MRVIEDSEECSLFDIVISTPASRIPINSVSEHQRIDLQNHEKPDYQDKTIQSDQGVPLDIVQLSLSDVDKSGSHGFVKSANRGGRRTRTTETMQRRSVRSTSPHVRRGPLQDNSMNREKKVRSISPLRRRRRDNTPKRSAQDQPINNNDHERTHRAVSPRRSSDRTNAKSQGSKGMSSKRSSDPDIGLSKSAPRLLSSRHHSDPMVDAERPESDKAFLDTAMVFTDLNLKDRSRKSTRRKGMHQSSQALHSSDSKINDELLRDLSPYRRSLVDRDAKGRSSHDRSLKLQKRKKSNPKISNSEDAHEMSSKLHDSSSSLELPPKQPRATLRKQSSDSKLQQPQMLSSLELRPKSFHGRSLKLQKRKKSNPKISNSEDAHEMSSKLHDSSSSLELPPKQPRATLRKQSSDSKLEQPQILPRRDSGNRLSLSRRLSDPNAAAKIRRNIEERRASASDPNAKGRLSRKNSPSRSFNSRSKRSESPNQALNETEKRRLSRSPRRASSKTEKRRLSPNRRSLSPNCALRKTEARRLSPNRRSRSLNRSLNKTETRGLSSNRRSERNSRRSATPKRTKAPVDKARQNPVSNSIELESVSDSIFPNDDSLGVRKGTSPSWQPTTHKGKGSDISLKESSDDSSDECSLRDADHMERRKSENENHSRISPNVDPRSTTNPDAERADAKGVPRNFTNLPPIVPSGTREKFDALAKKNFETISSADDEEEEEEIKTPEKEKFEDDVQTRASADTRASAETKKKSNRRGSAETNVISNRGGSLLGGVFARRLSNESTEAGKESEKPNRRGSLGSILNALLEVGHEQSERRRNNLQKI